MFFEILVVVTFVQPDNLRAVEVNRTLAPLRSRIFTLVVPDAPIHHSWRLWKRARKLEMRFPN